MTATAPRSRLRLSGRADRTAHAFDLQPDAEVRAAMAAELGLSSLRKLRFSGQLVPEGARDWRLDATLGATVVQPCGVTLEPVVTRIDQPVARRYLAEYQDAPPDAEEVEIPEDTETEAVPGVLDLDAVMIEALSLALPAFPRAEGAGIGTVTATAPGAEPLKDAALKPFAGLADAMKTPRD
ncbi:YceD family protein [Palleronia rufa]|uniref:YceD family protein n=1 Tax=Palleronia rufa TaxID=1530186 RepID=UPI00056063D3|nr:DUF177 domain-containing protein [Palleronia rufa]